MRFVKPFTHALFASLMLAGGLAHAALQPGDQAPDFETEAALAGKGYTYQLKAARQAGPVVVYFYPSAYTNGCNIQAHGFATRLEDFKAAGATVVGVSLDSIGRLREFSADPAYCAGRLSVASDADGRIAKAFALNVREAPAGRKDSRGQDIDHGLAERTTFIVTREGRIAATVGGLSPLENVEQALQAVRRLAAAR